MAIENATRLQPRRSGRPTYATVRRKLSVCRFLPDSYGFYSYIFRRPQRTGGRSSSIELPPSIMDASDQAGASLPCWTLGVRAVLARFWACAYEPSKPLSPWSVDQ